MSARLTTREVLLKQAHYVLGIRDDDFVNKLAAGQGSGDRSDATATAGAGKCDHHISSDALRQIVGDYRCVVCYVGAF